MTTAYILLAVVVVGFISISVNNIAIQRGNMKLAWFCVTMMVLGVAAVGALIPVLRGPGYENHRFIFDIVVSLGSTCGCLYMSYGAVRDGEYAPAMIAWTLGSLTCAVFIMTIINGCAEV